MGPADFIPTRLSARIRSIWRGLRDRNAVEAEMVEEFRHHLELRAADLVRRGLTPEQAARQARIEFGHIEGHRMDARASRGLAWFDRLGFSALDVRLGVRMLVKYPGLSMVSVVGMALAIAIGVGAFSILGALTATGLPLPGGDRVVALRNDLLGEPGRSGASLRDFLAWRDELGSVEDVSAFTTVRRNLVVPGGSVDLVRVVRMTASGFRLAQTAPVLGRTLLEEDERSGARVVVIAYEEWQRRFGADPGIIGRRIELGRDEYTIVGVMPEGFRFPVADRYWIPLAFGPAERREAAVVPVTIMGRLAEGATIERAQAELGVIGTRMAAAYPETHEQVRPRALHYTRAFFDMDNPGAIWSAHLFRLFLSLLLVVVAVNVAILVYARTATRVGEIAVRTALGASRARLVTQLFAEALVLTTSAAAVGLGIAGLGLAKLQEMAALYEGRIGALPFWMDLRLSAGAVVYALGLAILGAVIVGVLPALKATGRRVHTWLQQLPGQGSQLRLGRAWTVLIIAQVAVAVAVLPFAMHFTEEVVAEGTRDAGYPAEEFLEASLAMEPADGPPDTSAASQRAIEQRFRDRAAELVRRLESEPAVAGSTIRMPGSNERIEIDGSALPGAAQRPIAADGTAPIDRVEADFFALYGMPILAGRAFTEADARAGATTVVVNRVFVARHLGNNGVLGRRLRVLRESAVAGEVEAGPWLEIVGVVRDHEEYRFEPSEQIYRPLGVAQLSPPIRLAIRVRASPATSLVPRLRELAAAVDPVLQLDEVIGAAEQRRQGQQFSRYLGIGFSAMMLSVLLLSAAGIYAMMSFTVARRRREIGIRAALGAAPRRVLTSIFARASAQIGVGVLLGVVGTIALDRMTGRGPVHDGNVVVLLFVAALMTVVGLLAALGPARRGLAVPPTEALRQE